MTAQPIKILGVHGVGRHEIGGPWEGRWKESIAHSIAEVDPDAEITVGLVHYDDIFDTYEISFWDTVQALAKLTQSAVSAPFRKPRGVAGALRWSAGMVVQWVENDQVRRRTRHRLSERIKDFKPDVVVAHSLGSLVAYDTFTTDPSLIDQRIFVSLGSQIGNPFVSGNFRAGRIEALATARHWYHLFNDEDAVFAAPIRLSAENYDQVDTFFDIGGMADHDAIEYLTHQNAIDVVWDRVVTEHSSPRFYPHKVDKAAPSWSRSPRRRALLVGINDYPEPDMRLGGCVNDVYLMSETLQEAGFPAEDIRIVLNDRATARGIWDRLEWLVDGARAEDQRIFYYSGHGAQLPTYGLGDRVDRMDEALVPHDFDWTADRAITDDQFFQYYSLLPYETRFLTIFDCCHSGGMTRAGAPRIRGINPPDDIRHRAMTWDAATRMWRPRDLKTPDQEFRERHCSGQGPRSTHRLGHSMPLRQLSRRSYLARTKQQGHHGPYMPVLLYACQEDQYAYEYRHGSTSYGAFTFSLAKHFRQIRQQRQQRPNFRELCKRVSEDLTRLQFDQDPIADGPDLWVLSPVPFGAEPDQPRRKAARRKKRGKSKKRSKRGKKRT